MAEKDLAIQYKRQYAEHIDADYNFTTSERTAYLSNALRYAGQIVFDTDADALYRLNGARTAWVSLATGGGGGHTIKNSANTSMTARTNLKFIGATVTDNAGNDSTDVTITAGGVSSVNGDAGPAVVLDTDDIGEGATNKYFTETRVRAAVLTGLSLLTGTAITAADSVLTAFGKLQAQITANLARFQNSMTVDGTGLKFSSTDAVNAMANGISQVAVHTGFLRTDDSFTLGADLTAGANKLTISASQYGVAFSAYFNTPPYAPADGIKNLTSRTITLATIGAANPLPTNNTTIKFVGWAMPSDTIVFSDTSYVQSPGICQLGYIFYQNNAGTYEFVSPTRTFINAPDVSTESPLLTTVTGVSSTCVVTPISGGLTMKHTAGSIKGLSVNWGMGGNVHERTVTAQNPFTFTFRTPVSNTSLGVTTTTSLSGLMTQYWNGSTMTNLSNNNAAQVMRVMMSLRGGLVIQPGETEYASIVAAKDAVYAQQFTEVIPKGSYAEICRIAIIKTATDLGNLTHASFFVSGVGGGGGGTSSATFATIGGAATDNLSLATELSARLPIAPVVTTGTALTFTTDTIYGSEATPETGNITASTSGAVVGVTNLIIHNSGSAPTFDSKFYKLSGSGTYVLSVKNYIYCTYLSSTRIIYSINQ